MPRQLQRLAHYLTMVVLLIALRLSPVLMQTVAWARMLVDYSRTTSLTEAVAMTFDGNHPCALCQKVQEVQKEQQSDQKPQTLNSTRDIVFFYESPVMRLAPMVAMSPCQTPRHVSATLVTRSQKPPVPPPRLGA